MKKRLIVSLAILCFVTLSHEAPGRGAVPAIALHFSAQPNEAEIFRARAFDEPLVPMGGHPEAGENAALANALAKYSSRINPDDFSSLSSFLTSFPESVWTPSLLLHLGTEYYNTGHYSKALEAWEQAWQQCKNITNGPCKAQADRALGELARMYSKLGRMGDLIELLGVATNRPLQGPATQLIHSAQEALWMMQHRPDVSFRCGPLALDQILSAQNAPQAGNLRIIQSKSTTNGISLSQVAALSTQLGMNYQMAFRSSEAQLIVPSVVHWKVGHYAAILAKTKDRYLVKDHTFHSSLSMTATALNEEASGYFLVPSGPLPAGWRSVSKQEAQKIWGKGTVTGQNSGGTGPNDSSAGGSPPGCPGGGGSGGGAGAGGGCGGMGGMTTYTMHLMLASLTLNDMPVGYSPPLGPNVYFNATYNQLEANQPATFYYSNLGQKWDFNWLSYVTDNPDSPGADITLYQSGGGTVDYSGYNATTQSYALELMSQTILVRSSISSYEQQFQDGSKREFALSDGSTGTARRIFMTQIIDPAGNAVQLQYDALLRLTNIVDTIGQSTTLAYTNAAYPYAITQVTDPFKRSASFQYNSQGLLAQITDVLGITSYYTYGANEFVNTLTTPYGTTTFTTGATNGFNWIQATDPLGECELADADEIGIGIPDSDPASIVPAGMNLYNDALHVRNTFFWGKQAFQQGAWVYTNATIYHFLHDLDQTTESRVLESVKNPLENRVWYNYPAQPAAYQIGPESINRPSAVGRVLDDGASQVYYYGYNSAGNITNFIDPLGRAFTLTYGSNNVDLSGTFMDHNGQYQVLSSAAYNSQHRPLTITDASGQTTTNTYNARGQLLTTSDPLGELTTYVYDTNGYLLSITGPLESTNDAINLTYDGVGRVRTVTDTEGYTLTFDYDAFDRKTRITHPDGTFEQFIYSNLDLVAKCDRLNRWTTNAYNADRQLIQTQDPLGRVAGFEWCQCGAMTGLIDPMGRETTWDYDLESRPIAKHYVDGSTISYVYENTTSRLSYKVDEQGQETFYQYNIDNTLADISYPNATIPTPTVVYTYDPDYYRIRTMKDGIGTTVYTYNSITPTPAIGGGRLASVSGPLPNSTVTYQYDQLGRVVTRAINGVAQATTYDVLGRSIVVTNALGKFQYGYVDATARLTSAAYPNGQTNLYSYYNNLGDQRLLQIQHLYPNGSLLSAFGYSYNAVGQITGWTNQWDTLPMRIWLPGYDAADQLTNVACTGGPFPITNFAYAYDLTGNRTLAQSNSVQDRFNYNALNQLIGAAPSLTNSATYEWDAENRLTAITRGSNRSEFYYDGLGRRTEIVETVTGNIVSNYFFVWCATGICEQRDSTGSNVTKRFFGQGEQLVTSNSQPKIDNYYFTRDHLGSIRETLDSNGTATGRYDYDPYGKPTVIQQNFKPDFTYAGYFCDPSSGLYFTLYRPLNSGISRWLTRDPIGENVGFNLYVYVGNNPINFIDPMGLCQFTSGGGLFGGFLITGGYNGGQWNFGAYLGVGEGAFASFDPSDTGSHEPGTDFGLRGEGEIGAGDSITGAFQFNLNGEFTGNINLSDPTTTGQSWSKTDPSQGPTYGLGSGGFIGFGGTTYFPVSGGGGNSTSFPNPQPNASVNSSKGLGGGGSLTGHYNTTSGSPETGGSPSCQPSPSPNP